VTDVIALQRSAPRTKTLLYYGWINVAIAAAAMAATMLGRPQVVGVITEPLLRDLQMDHVAFGFQNMWATLIASVFSVACGPLIDRIGARAMITLMLAALGASLVYMSKVTGPIGLFIGLTLTRGFGQSALSAVSLALVGKWFSRRLPIAMGVYSLLAGIGCVVVYIEVAKVAFHTDWRHAWDLVGWIILIGGVISWILVRSTPQAMRLSMDGIPAEAAGGTLCADDDAIGATLRQALASPAFWAYALAASVFGMLSAALTLFNEAVLHEHGFDKHIAVKVMSVVMLTGLLANFGGGWLGQKISVGRLMAGAMFLHALSLLALPVAHTAAVVYLYAVLMGISGGIVTVAFFTCWGKVFGRAHLGAIQGAAQGLTVVTSSAGPVLLAGCVHLSGSSTPLFYFLAPVVGLLGVFCLLVKTPTFGSPSPELL
jgi:MFS family permease